MAVKRMRAWLALGLFALVCGSLLSFAAAAAPADPTGGEVSWRTISGQPATVQNVAATVANLKVGLNLSWLLVCTFLVFLMQAGFALVETGFCRAKNAANVMMMNMIVFCVGVAGFFLTGFALMFGGYGLSATSTLGDLGLMDGMLTVAGLDVVGTKGFMLTGFYDISVAGLFLFQLVFMDTAATIPTGAMAERLSWKGFLVMGLWVSMFIYPLIGCWVWGGGWLADLGLLLGLGHGAVDFAGSGVVHTVGGTVALVGAIVLGPRIGKYGRDGSVNPLPGHSFPMVILGVVILYFGWFGFNAGSSLAASDLRISVIALNTMLAGGFGGLAAMFRMWIWERKPDPGYSCNGILAGLVAVTAGCAFIEPWAAAVIGILAGGWVCDAGLFIERTLKIDDPCGAVAVHFCNGLWGLLAVGIFADGTYGEGWNGVPGTVTGLLYGGGFGQLAAQLAEALTILCVVGVLTFGFFRMLDRISPLRVSANTEMAGLDVPEMGIWGYPDPEASFAPNSFKTAPPPASGVRPPMAQRQE